MTVKIPSRIEKAINYFNKRVLDEHGYPINLEHCETALNALYRANKIKPVLYNKHYFRCPCCKNDLGIDVDDISVYAEIPPNYCSKCGQALDWSDYLK